MTATGPGGTITSKTFRNPPAHKGCKGPVVIPYQFIHQGKKTNDGDRISVDSCKTVDFHGGPKVTVLPKGFYQGELGHIGRSGYRGDEEYYYQGPLGYISDRDAASL